MIEHDTQLKIQAFLDGELSGSEANQIAALLAANPEAAALHTELKQTRRALAGAEQGTKLPESREFYWSKISREIERLDRGTPARPVSVWHALSAWLKPLGAVAAVAIVAILVWQQTGGGNAGHSLVTAQIDSDAMTFQDDTTGTTFVWFNYPVENRVANEGDSNTIY